MKKAVTLPIRVISLVLLLLGFCGCGHKPPMSERFSSLASNSSVPSATESAYDSSSSTTSNSSPTAASSPTTESDQALQEKFDRAPVLDGAVKKVRMLNGLRRVTYAASPENPYGVSAGEYLGEYKGEVLLGGTTTGGVALVPEALLPLLSREISELPDGSEKWLLPLPVDISDCLSLRPVRIERTAKPFIDKPYYIQVQFDEEILDVANILTGDQGLIIDKFPMFEQQFVVSRLSMDNHAIIPGQEMAFLFVIAVLDDPIHLGENEPVPFGARVGRTGKPVLAGLSSIRGPFREHTFSCLPYLGACPVFAISR